MYLIIQNYDIYWYRLTLIDIRNYPQSFGSGLGEFGNGFPGFFIKIISDFYLKPL